MMFDKLKSHNWAACVWTTQRKDCGDTRHEHNNLWIRHTNVAQWLTTFPYSPSPTTATTANDARARTYTHHIHCHTMSASGGPLHRWFRIILMMRGNTISQHCPSFAARPWSLCQAVTRRQRYRPIDNAIWTSPCGMADRRSRARNNCWQVGQWRRRLMHARHHSTARLGDERQNHHRASRPQNDISHICSDKKRLLVQSRRPMLSTRRRCTERRILSVKAVSPVTNT